MFDLVQARHRSGTPLRLCTPRFLKQIWGLRHQILDHARGEDFAGSRCRGDTRSDVKRKADHLGPAHVVFARMQPSGRSSRRLVN